MPGITMNQKSKPAHWFDEIEEANIAICMGLMTLVTFANVVARYIFNSNILWALELTVFLFAWLVLMGASYAVKKQVHIGVDVVVSAVQPKARRLFALVAVSTCLTFSTLLLIGSWNYWYPFITERTWMETNDIPMPQFLMFLADWLNEGEAYEKVPRFIPYVALPLGMGLMTLRFLQQLWKVINGDIDRIIASHEVEDELVAAQKQRGAS